MFQDFLVWRCCGFFLECNCLFFEIFEKYGLNGYVEIECSGFTSRDVSGDVYRLQLSAKIIRSKFAVHQLLFRVTL